MCLSLRQATALLFSPTRLFKQQRNRFFPALRTALLLGLVLSMIAGTLAALDFSTAASLPFLSVLPASIAGTYGFTLLLVTAWGIWVHAWARLFGAHDIAHTMQAIYLGAVPYLLFGWLPGLFTNPVSLILTVAILLWELLIQLPGLAVLHKMKGRTADLALTAALLSALFLVFIALPLAVNTIILQ